MRPFDKHLDPTAMSNTLCYSSFWMVNMEYQRPGGIDLASREGFWVTQVKQA